MSLRLRPLRHDGDLVYVPLSRGLETVVDASDAALVAGRNWHACASFNTNYAHSNLYVPAGRDTVIRLHRLILQPPEGVCIDHIDGDGLNNRRSNLRLASIGENIINRGIQKNNKSGFKGVSWRKAPGKWLAQIGYSRRCIFLGLFDSPEEASCAYRAAAQKLHGEFARLG